MTGLYISITATINEKSHIDVHMRSNDGVRRRKGIVYDNIILKIKQSNQIFTLKKHSLHLFNYFFLYINKSIFTISI